jgi:UDP-N-acetylglucosamine enolpyruvyl transferase
MSILKVQGGRRLAGRLSVEGNKNSALPLIAACLLSIAPKQLPGVVLDVAQKLLEIVVHCFVHHEGAK